MDKTQLFNEFITENIDSACKFATIYVKNYQDAEDVVSESIEKALRRMHTLKNPEFMKTWFYRIIINTSMDHLKKQSKTVLLGKDVPVQHFDDFSRIDVNDLLDMLPEGDRKIVSMRFVDNCALNEIAEELGMNENTVKTRLYRALKKLKLVITDEDYKAGRSTVKTLTMIVAAALLSAVCLFNAFPALAAAVIDIPVIGDIVRVITFNRFEYKDMNRGAEVRVPEIQGLLDPELQDRLNAEFSEYADDLIRSFEATIIELDESGDESAYMSVKADYVVKADTDRVISLDTYLYSDVGNYVIHEFYTIDKKTGMLITLHDLFKPGTDYITPISAYIVSEMERMNREEEATYSVGETMFTTFTEIKPDQNFYISNEGELVICFDKYEVAAGVQGSPEFVIPSELIIDISTSDLLK